MLHVKPIVYEQVNDTTQLKAELFLQQQCQLHYGDKITPERYEELFFRLKQEMQRTDHRLLLALNEDHEVVGCITLSRYDNRIASLKERYDQGKVAEVSRCYVHERYRRRGIGAQLFEQACSFAKAKKYAMLYLHTHYFLPGGFSFWRAMGFEITVDEGGSWQTVHMERLVEDEALRYA